MAALAVLVTHVSFATGFNGHGALGAALARLDVGVPIFFVLSGFLLYRPFVAARRTARPGPDMARYARRRVARIYPAYWVVLVVVLLQTRELANGVRGLLAQILLLHTWWPDTVFGPPATSTGGVTFHPLGQAWTLAAEVVFYLALPFWALLIRRLTTSAAPAHRWRAEAVGLVVLVAVAQAWRVWMAHAALNASQVAARSSWVFNQLDHFAFGMALAVISVELVARGRTHLPGMAAPWLPVACWTAAAACFYGAIHWAGLHPNQVLYTNHQQMARQWFYGGTAVFALLPAMLAPPGTGWVARLFASPPLRALGRVSYGIYLWQELVLFDWLRLRDQKVFTGSFPATLAVVLVVTVVVATVSWFVVERPLLHRAR
jgi:peptidoglycan/LPS O-acetylase OafA/YrhL